MATPAVKQRSQGTVATRNPLQMLRREMEDLVARFWDGDDVLGFAGPLVPMVDVSESANAFEIRMDVPGMEAKDIDVQVHGNTVTLSGHRKEEKEEEGTTYHRLERRTGSFSRTMTLPSAVNEDEVAAAYTQGVLTVTLPKSESGKPKSIPIRE